MHLPKFSCHSKKTYHQFPFSVSPVKDMLLFCVGIAKDLDGQKWEELYHQILLFNAVYDAGRIEKKTARF